MSLDKHFAVFFVYGQQGANISRNEIFRVPVWSVAACESDVLLKDTHLAHFDANFCTVSLQALY